MAWEARGKASAKTKLFIVATENHNMKYRIKYYLNSYNMKADPEK